MNRRTLIEQLKELKVQELLTGKGKRWALICDRSFRSLMSDWGIAAERVISLSQLTQNLDSLQANKTFAIVCTEASEAPVLKRLKEKNAAGIGLYSHLIPRLAAGVAPRFSPPQDTNIKLQYCIFCLPRCGSTLVSRELQLLNAGNPVEHFRGFLADLLKHRDVSRFDFQKWWRTVILGHTVEGIFGTKVIYDFWKMANRHFTDEDREFIKGSFRNSKIIYIERADKIGQAVSDIVARRTGVWHVKSDKEKEKYLGRIKNIDRDIETAFKFYRKFVAHELELKGFLEEMGTPVIRIDYDDLLSRPKETIARAATAMGIEVDAGYNSSELALEPTTTDVHRELRELLQERIAVG